MAILGCRQGPLKPLYSDLPHNLHSLNHLAVMHPQRQSQAPSIPPERGLVLDAEEEGLLLHTGPGLHINFTPVGTQIHRLYASL